VIDIRELEFAYAEGDFRLSVPRMTVERGASAAFIGPSGSGKTTLLNLIAGIAAPHAGHIETQGVVVSRLSEAERRDFRVAHVGLVFQEFELLEYLSVFDNILLPYRISSALRLDRGVRDRAVDLARQVGIADKLRRHPRSLSQGERQRVAVCRAVLAEPGLLLADEPTGNLDPGNAQRVLDILFDYAERHGATFVAVTHDHTILPRFERVVDLLELQTTSGDQRPVDEPTGDRDVER